MQPQHHNAQQHEPVEAWLIDPIKEHAYIYRADGTVEILEGLDHVLSGEDVCPGLLFDLATMRV